MFFHHVQAHLLAGWQNKPLLTNLTDAACIPSCQFLRSRFWCEGQLRLRRLSLRLADCGPDSVSCHGCHCIGCCGMPVVPWLYSCGAGCCCHCCCAGAVVPSWLYSCGAGCCCHCCCAGAVVPGLLCRGCIAAAPQPVVATAVVPGLLCHGCIAAPQPVVASAAAAVAACGADAPPWPGLSWPCDAALLAVALHCFLAYCCCFLRVGRLPSVQVWFLAWMRSGCFLRVGRLPSVQVWFLAWFGSAGEPV